MLYEAGLFEKANLLYYKVGDHATNLINVISVYPNS